MEQEYIITVFSENKVGLLSQITTVFTCRDVNIESLTTSESALQGIQQIHHRGPHHTRSGRQTRAAGREEDRRAEDLRLHPRRGRAAGDRPLQGDPQPGRRTTRQREHNVRILEIDEDYIVVEKTGHKADTQALFRLLQPYGVQQFVRSGTVAIIKSRRELLNEYLEEIDRLRAESDEEGSKSEK